MGCGAPGEALPDRSAESFRFGISVGLEVCQRMVAPRAWSSYSYEDVPRRLDDIFERLRQEGFGQASVDAVPDFENETTEWRFVFRLPGGDCRAWGGAATDCKCSCYAWMWRGVLHAVLAELIWRVGERGRGEILQKIAALSQESSVEFAQARLRALWFRRVWSEPSPGGEGMASMIVQAPDVFRTDALAACVPIL